MLVRTHAQVPAITEALRVTGVPYRVRGADALLDSRMGTAALDLLRRGGGRLAGCLPDLAALADGDGDADPDEPGRDAGTGAGAVDVIVRLAEDHLRLDPGATASGFASWLVATVAAEGTDGRSDAVTVATFHAAKGLEWPIVHLAGLEDGLVPIAYARTIAQRQEEARLLYVAMTRAEDELLCTWAAERRVGTGGPVERRLTPWLDGLAAERAEAANAAGANGRNGGSRPAPDPFPDWRQHLADQRARLAAAAAGPATEPALAALLSWREASARAARVEPAALVDDRLLEAIAERRPATRDELVAVPGMGPVLAARVGDGLLAALHDRSGG